MKLEVDLLYDLQQLDSRISEIKELQASLDDGSRVARQVETIQEELQQIETALKNTKRKLKTKDLDLQTVENKTRELQSRLYSGTIRNPKELSSIQKEIEALKENKDTLETQVLELMDKADSEERALQEVRERLSEKENELRSLREEYQSRLSELRRELEDLSRRREEVTSLITQPMLNKYEDLRVKCNNLAVAKIDSDVCSGCHMNLPESQIRQVKKGDSLVYCEHCGRILYWEG